MNSANRWIGNLCVYACAFLSLMMGVTGCGGKGSNVAIPSLANSNDVTQVQSDVRRLLDAVYAGDSETILAATPPQLIAAMGGRAKAANILDTLHQKHRSEGMALESVTFPTDPKFLTSKRHQFALVPTKNVIRVGEIRMESLHFQFGIKESGHTNWTFLDGSQINSSNIAKFFTDFPSKFQFPPTYKRPLRE